MLRRLSQLLVRDAKRPNHIVDRGDGELITNLGGDPRRGRHHFMGSLQLLSLFVRHTFHVDSVTPGLTFDGLDVHLPPEYEFLRVLSISSDAHGA